MKWAAYSAVPVCSGEAGAPAVGQDSGTTNEGGSPARRGTPCNLRIAASSARAFGSGADTKFTPAKTATHLDKAAPDINFFCVMA